MGLFQGKPTKMPRDRFQGKLVMGLRVRKFMKVDTLYAKHHKLIKLNISIDLIHP